MLDKPTPMPGASMTKADWLNKIDQTSQDWETIVQRVGADTDALITETWTLKGIAAHLNGWREWTARRLEAATNGSEPLMPWPAGMTEETDEGTDEINAWFEAESETQSTQAVLDTTRAQFHRMRSAIEAIPADALNQSPPWLEGYPLWAVIDGSLGHFYEDHKPDLDAYLQQQGSGNRG